MHSGSKGRSPSGWHDRCSQWGSHVPRINSSVRVPSRVSPSPSGEYALDRCARQRRTHAAAWHGGLEHLCHARHGRRTVCDLAPCEHAGCERGEAATARSDRREAQPGLRPLLRQGVDPALQVRAQQAPVQRVVRSPKRSKSSKRSPRHTERSAVAPIKDSASSSSSPSRICGGPSKRTVPASKGETPASSPSSPIHSTPNARVRCARRSSSSRASNGTRVTCTASGC
jgi:hypothetical protein